MVDFALHALPAWVTFASVALFEVDAVAMPARVGEAFVCLVVTMFTFPAATTDAPVGIHCIGTIQGIRTTWVAVTFVYGLRAQRPAPTRETVAAILSL